MKLSRVKTGFKKKRKFYIRVYEYFADGMGETGINRFSHAAGEKASYILVNTTILAKKRCCIIFPF